MLISNAMPQAISIDNYLDTHQGNKEIELCGKLAIAACILDAERKSLLKNSHEYREEIDFSRLSNTWYNSFQRILMEGTRVSNLDSIFDNISMVIFNYDRCVERFLVFAIKNYYNVSLEEACALLKKLKIFHPYGTIDELSWSDNDPGIRFGNDYSGSKLLSVSEKIKTFTETTEGNGESLDLLKAELQNADSIVFMGFAFHPMSMKLLSPPDSSVVENIYASAFGISGSDCEVIKRRIRESLKIKGIIPINISNTWKCNDLLLEHKIAMSL